MGWCSKQGFLLKKWGKPKMIPQNWGLLVGGGRWDAQNAIEGDIWNHIFCGDCEYEDFCILLSGCVGAHFRTQFFRGNMRCFVTHPSPCGSRNFNLATTYVPQWGRAQTPDPDLHHRLSSWFPAGHFEMKLRWPQTTWQPWKRAHNVPPRAQWRSQPGGV